MGYELDAAMENDFLAHSHADRLTTYHSYTVLHRPYVVTGSKSMSKQRLLTYGKQSGVGIWHSQH